MEKTLTELKAIAYDLQMEIQMLNNEFRKVNELIVTKMNEERELKSKQTLEETKE
jgi:hypothetical protein